MKENIIFVGGCGHGKETTNGVAAKNYFLLQRLKEVFPTVKVVDTDGWKKNPFILLKLTLLLTAYPDYKIVISLNTPSAYKFIRIAHALFPQRHLCYFVIGGVLASYLEEGKIKKIPFKCVNWFMVESLQMKEKMTEMGFANTLYVPNFKNISYLPTRKPHQAGRPIHFVFLSRIIPEKGCDYIIDAVKMLNSQGLAGRFCVHFYGTIADSYNKVFHQQIASLTNVEYKGFLDLRKVENYDVLAQYDVMLFPTYWHGEGFPGIIIDAFIAGLPVIASDWGHNSEIIETGKNGVIIPARNVEELSKQMLAFTKNTTERERMSQCCQAAARKYNTRNILSEQLLAKIIHPQSNMLTASTVC